MDEPGMRRLLLRRQDGLGTRRQLAEVGATKPHLDRLLRRKQLVRVRRGVFVDHTGELTDLQRAWAAVPYAAPAALCLESASDLSARPVHVAVDWTRRLVAPPPGVRVHRVRGLAARVRWNQWPPRVRLEHAVLDQVERANGETEIVRLMTEAAGRTTAAPVARGAAGAGPGPPTRLAGGGPGRHRRGLLLRARAPLPHSRRAPHGLPPATRQVTRTTASGRQYRDVEYEELGLVVELDGRIGHDTWDARGRDADRDPRRPDRGA